MSNLGIFSLLVVGRDMPHPFANAQKAAIRQRSSRAPPIVQDSGRFADLGGNELFDAPRSPQAAADAGRRTSSA
jgi:hypothetical protein